MIKTSGLANKTPDGPKTTVNASVENIVNKGGKSTLSSWTNGVMNVPSMK